MRMEMQEKIRSAEKGRAFEMPSRQQVDTALSAIREGAEFWKNFLEKTEFTTQDYVVVLLSKEQLINEHTLKYLAALKAEKHLNRIFLFAEKYMDEKKLADAATAPVEILFCDEKDLEHLAGLQMLYNFSSQISFNSFQGSTDNDGFCLTELKQISVDDVISIAVLGLEKVPAEMHPKPAGHFGCKAINWNAEQQGVILSSEFDTIENRIRNGLETILARNYISKKDSLVLFGATTASMQIIDQLAGWHIDAIVDNNKSKQGTLVRGIPVYSPEDYLGNCHKEVKILIASQYYRQMCEQLYYLGYELGRQVFVIFGEKNKWDVTESTIQYMEEAVWRGFQILCDMRRKYPDRLLMVCPYAGTGDLYLIGLYQTELEKNQKAVYIVCSNACAKTAALFRMQTETLSLEDIRALGRVLCVLGIEQSGAKILNDCFYQLSITKMHGYKGIDFHTMFASCIFHVKNRKPNIPQWKQDSSDSIFEQHHLQKGKTVLLSPYANTISNIPISMWEEIILQLQQKGFDVCTNVSSPEEKALPGTAGIFIPYSQVIDFLDQAGHFIGLRSGLCDIISTTKATVSILYPEGKVFTNCTTYEYFSLEKMGFRTEKLLEIEYTERKQEQDVERIIHFIEE